VSATSLILSSGSLTLIVAWILIGGLGVPVPEDPAVLAAGALIYHGVVSPFVAVPVVIAAVVAGDLALFSLARRLGADALDRPTFQRILPPHRRQQIEEAYRRHGGKLIFVARHVAGVRAATFALAGINRMPVRRFLLWDGLAACISVPVVIGLGYAFALHIERVRKGLATVEHWIVLAAIVFSVVVLALRGLRRVLPAHADTDHAKRPAVV
jgi:membrane protein DedA with SNARE-associated domain